MKGKDTAEAVIAFIAGAAAVIGGAKLLSAIADRRQRAAANKEQNCINAFCAAYPESCLHQYSGSWFVKGQHDGDFQRFKLEQCG